MSHEGKSDRSNTVPSSHQAVVTFSNSLFPLPKNGMTAYLANYKQRAQIYSEN